MRSVCFRGLTSRDSGPMVPRDLLGVLCVEREEIDLLTIKHRVLSLLEKCEECNI